MYDRDELASKLALHVLTDRVLSRGRSMSQVAQEAIYGGATVIQLRDKSADTRTLVEEGLELRSITRKHGCLLIVNDRIDVAQAIEADGVHLGQDDMPVEIAREILGPNAVIGVSAGTKEEALRVAGKGADYLSVGPIYSTSTKSDAGPAIGTDMIRMFIEEYGLPVIAIGGITVQNCRPVLEAGAVGLAVVSAVVGGEDIREATRELVQTVEMYRGEVESKAL